MGFNFLDTVLPAGVSSSALVALYQFDGGNSPLNDKSGNGYDLEKVGTCPYSIEEQGEPVVQAMDGGYLRTVNTQTGVFNTLGELTVEMIYRKALFGGTITFSWCIGETAVATEANNAICGMYTPSNAHASLTIGVAAFHERGGGADLTTQFDWALNPFGLSHVALTRGSDGKTYKLYIDGVLVDTAEAANPPTGGTGAIRIYILGSGVGAYDDRAYMSSWRYCKGVEFTADQVLESYNRVYVA